MALCASMTGAAAGPEDPCPERLVREVITGKSSPSRLFDLVESTQDRHGIPIYKLWTGTSLSFSEVMLLIETADGTKYTARQTQGTLDVNIPGNVLVYADFGRSTFNILIEGHNKVAMTFNQDGSATAQLRYLEKVTHDSGFVSSKERKITVTRNPDGLMQIERSDEGAY